MEVGEGSGSNNGRHRRSQKPKQNPKPKQKRQRRASVGISFEQSVENLSGAGRATLVMVQQEKHSNLLNSISFTTCAVFDNHNPHYEKSWLRSGWLVEEREKLFSSRLYRYYYDPAGQTYRTRIQVETIYRDIENNRIVVNLDN